MAGSEIKPGERVKDVHIGDDKFSVDLIDGRTITVPYAWFPRLLHATPAERSNWQLSAFLEPIIKPLPPSTVQFSTPTCAARVACWE